MRTTWLSAFLRHTMFYTPGETDNAPTRSGYHTHTNIHTVYITHININIHTYIHTQFILDLRPFKDAGIVEEDVAKRLQVHTYIHTFIHTYIHT